MSVSRDTFERYRQKGLDARRAGQWDAARIYLLEAARTMVTLANEAQGEELREARRQTAARLLELARDCDKAKTENRKQSPGALSANPPAKPREAHQPTNGSSRKNRGSNSTMSPASRM